MKKLAVTICSVLFVLAASVHCTAWSKEAKEMSVELSVTSPAFRDQEPIPKRNAGDGGNISPALVIGNVPGAAKSLALIVDDPDAPSGTYTHWVVFNIPPSVREIKEGQPPSGSSSGRNSAGETKYFGPYPPPGKVHHYVFRAYALDALLPLKTGAGKKDVEAAMTGHILAKGTLTGLYRR